MDTKKFERATEIMNELKRLCESEDNLKNYNELIFSLSDRGEMESFCAKSEVFIACRDVAIRVVEKRIAQLDKEFNEL